MSNEIKNSSSFFRNTECAYFPCHQVSDSTNFNCMFCYCPLYHLESCGGNYYDMDNGMKDCSRCTIPHKIENYAYIIDRLR